MSARLTKKQILLGTLQPALAPTQAQRVQIGHLVRVRKDNDTEFAFILGGEGEVDNGSEFPTLGCTAPLGMAVKGKSIGVHIEVRANDRAYEIEIVSISIPFLKKLRAQTPA